jgi:hypothetical protein
MQDRIEIIEIGLDKNIRKEIEESTVVSEEIQIKIKGHLDGMKRQTVNKRVIREREWEGKLDIIFNLLKKAYDEDPKQAVPKHAIIESVSCTEKEFSPIMQKFKKYLRTTKEKEWTISKRRIRGVSNYALVPFG